MLEDVRIALESPDQDAVRKLFEQAAECYDRIYPPETNLLASPAELIDSKADFLVARHEGEICGFAAVIPLADGIYELKRMYVVPGLREQGIGKLLLEKSLALLKPRHARAVRLETGTKQLASISLYQSAGFVEIPAFPPYEDNPNSLFMELSLGR